MSYCRLVTTIAIAGLVAAGCSENTQEQSPGEVLARDSSLASGIRQADTSEFADAADVATAFDPDSVLPPVGRNASSRGSPAEAPPAAKPSVSSTSPAPTRADRPRLRPKPATIHPEPIPTRALPPASARSATAAKHVDRSAAEILAKVPGAEVTPTAKSRAIAKRSRRGV